MCKFTQRCVCGLGALTTVANIRKKVPCSNILKGRRTSGGGRNVSFCRDNEGRTPPAGRPEWGSLKEDSNCQAQRLHCSCTPAPPFLPPAPQPQHSSSSSSSFLASFSSLSPSEPHPIPHLPFTLNPPTLSHPPASQAPAHRPRSSPGPRGPAFCFRKLELSFMLHHDGPKFVLFACDFSFVLYVCNTNEIINITDIMKETLLGLVR